MAKVKERAYAKLNLTLDLLGVSGGYHMLDSLVTTVDLYDIVTLKSRKDKLVTVKMHGLSSELISLENNNAYKAAKAFIEQFQTNGVDITVQKNIPIGAGMGGSSTDAAAVLRGMAKLYSVKDSGALKRIADALGSDTGYLLTGGFARMQGRGERVQSLVICPNLYYLLILPNSGVSTAECYRKSDELPALPPVTEEVIRLLSSGDTEGAGKLFSNGLYPAAALLNGEVKVALEEAQSFSPTGAAMTGSGSCVFACFPTVELCQWAKSRYRGKSETLIVKSINNKLKNWSNPFTLSGEEE